MRDVVPNPREPTRIVVLTEQEIDALLNEAAESGEWIFDLDEHKAALASAIAKLRAIQFP